MPQSSQMFWAGGGVWNDESVSELEAYYQQLSAEHALDPRRVVLGGFSMGGEIALRAALTSAIPARGFVVFGPGGGPADCINTTIPTTTLPDIKKTGKIP